MKPVLPQEKYISINGLRLHYVDWGNDEYAPMLLLHGFTGHAHVWDDFAKAMQHRFHVISLTQRGHGESQWSKKAYYSIDHHFSDIAQFIDSLGLENLIIIGHSMGGRNALFYTACIPEKVKKLIVVDSRPGNSPMGSNALKRHIQALSLQAKGFEEIVSAAQQLYPYLPRETCLHMAKHGFKRRDDGTLTPKCDMSMGLASQQSGYAAEELWPLIGNITCPTLIIRGEESLFLSAEEARDMCEVLPDAKCKEIPCASHLPTQENPEVFNKVVLDFLNNA